MALQLCRKLVEFRPIELDSPRGTCTAKQKQLSFTSPGSEVDIQPEPCPLGARPLQVVVCVNKPGSVHGPSLAPRTARSSGADRRLCPKARRARAALPRWRRGLCPRPRPRKVRAAAPGARPPLPHPGKVGRPPTTTTAAGAAAAAATAPSPTGLSRCGIWLCRSSRADGRGAALRPAVAVLLLVLPLVLPRFRIPGCAARTAEAGWRGCRAHPNRRRATPYLPRAHCAARAAERNVARGTVLACPPARPRRLPVACSSCSPQRGRRAARRSDPSPATLKAPASLARSVDGRPPRPAPAYWQGVAAGRVRVDWPG